MKCGYMMKSGKPCKAMSLNGSEYCFFHDPRSAEKRKKAQKAGGLQRSRETATEHLEKLPGDMEIKTLNDITTLLTTTINDVRNFRTDHRQANVIGYLAQIIIRAFEHSSAELMEEERQELQRHRLCSEMFKGWTKEDLLHYVQTGEKPDRFISGYRPPVEEENGNTR